MKSFLSPSPRHGIITIVSRRVASIAPAIVALTPIRTACSLASMITIIHTADLHLGKTLHGRDISPDQSLMLAALVDAVAGNRADALVIAGDIYDRSIPPPETVRLFDGFLMDLFGRSPATAVILIPGNHDSAARLSFGAGIFERAGFHIRTRAQDCVRPITLTVDGETVQIWALPFLSSGSFRDAFDKSQVDEDAAVAAPRGQSELLAEAVSRIGAVMDSSKVNVLVAHCFAAGSAMSESERGFVGMAEVVDPGVFSGFDYVALGHLHRPQIPGGSGRIRYPGSPLAYSFGESGHEKGFTLVELDGKNLSATMIPFAPLHPLRTIRGLFADLADPERLAAEPEAGDADYLEVILTDPEPVLNPLDILRTKYPNLLSLRQEIFERGMWSTLGEYSPEGGAAGASSAAALDPVRAVVADFSVFYREMRGTEPADPVTKLFGELLGEVEHAAV